MSGESLVEILATISDPRGRSGKIHPLHAVLGLTVVALLAGMKSLEAIAQFGRDHGLGLAHALGFRRAKTPNKSMLSKLFRRLDIEEFEEKLRGWLQQRLGDDEVIAIDGKTLRGSATAEVPGLHLVTAYASKTAVVLGKLRVAATTNEHKAALELLGVLPVGGKVVTADAMFTHRDFCEKVASGGGDYLLPVKDNQPVLQTEIAAAFDDVAFSPLPTAASGSRASECDHGGQGARSPGATVDSNDHVLERLRELAQGGTSLRTRTRANDQRENERGSGVWDHQSES